MTCPIHTEMVKIRDYKTRLICVCFLLINGDKKVHCLRDSILESRLPGGLRQGSLCRSCSKDLFMSFMRALKIKNHNIF